MATVQQLLAKEGRLIAQASGGLFDASTRLEYLNVAYVNAQARIAEVKTSEFLRRATLNIAVGVDGTRARYQRPTSENVRMLEIRGSTSAAYSQVRKIIREQSIAQSGDIVSFSASNPGGGYCYYEEGDEYVIVPTPPADVTAGLRATFYNMLTMSADTDVPRMPVALHRLLPYGAAIYLLEDSKDADDSIVDGYRARWASKFGVNDASTQESRAALALTFRQHEPGTVVGMRLG